MNQTIVCHNHVNNENTSYIHIYKIHHHLYKTNEAMEGKPQTFSILKTQSRLVIRSNSKCLLLWHHSVSTVCLFIPLRKDLYLTKTLKAIYGGLPYPVNPSKSLKNHLIKQPGQY